MNSDNKRITKITKRDIVDMLNCGITLPGEDELKRILWFGRLDDIKFLKRLYELQVLPSHDGRFKNAEGDIWQHTVNNDDFEYDWVFYDDRFGLENGKDEVFLRFICEMFHPAVTRHKVDDKDSTEYTYFKKINELLRADGYELITREYISGRPIFTWKNILTRNIVIERESKLLTVVFDSKYIQAQIVQMNASIEENPTDAIGKAKELIESCCKTILKSKDKTIDKNWTVSRLMKETCKSLKLTPDDISDTAKASDTIKQILGSLTSISVGMAALRNPYGSGHGKSNSYKGLTSRHARLAVGAATTAVFFLWETFMAQEERNL